MKKPKLCYIIPEYRERDATHLSYLLPFVERRTDDFDLFLIIERSNARISTRIRCYQQKFSWLPLRFLENIFIIKYARSRGYKDFYVHYSFLSAFNASCVVRCFSGRVFYWNCGLPWKYQRNWFRERFERLVYRMVAYLVTGTEGLKKEYANHYRIPLEKIKVVPNWIDVEKIENQSTNWRTKIKIEEIKTQLEIPESAKVLLFVHRLSQRKGAHHIPEIIRRLRDENVILLVVGDGPEKKDLKLKIKNQKLEDKVRFLGAVPHSGVIRYFAISDVLIMPSEEEGFPHVLLEAMATETPFVAFDVGGVNEITPPEAHKFLHPAGDIERFLESVRSLLANDTLRTCFRNAEKEWVMRYDINAVAKQFHELFKT